MYVEIHWPIGWYPLFSLLFQTSKMDTKMICIYKLHFSWLCLFVGQGVSASWLSVEGVCMCTPTSMVDPLSRLSLSEATAGKTDPSADADPNISKKGEWIHEKINYKNPFSPFSFVFLFFFALLYNSILFIKNHTWYPHSFLTLAYYIWHMGVLSRDDVSRTILIQIRPWTLTSRWNL